MNERFEVLDDTVEVKLADENQGETYCFAKHHNEDDEIVITCLYYVYGSTSTPVRDNVDFLENNEVSLDYVPDEAIDFLRQETNYIVNL